MIRKSLLVTLLLLLPFHSYAASSVLWQGGLWNLDYPSDVSTYGYFRLLLESDTFDKEARVLKVEWIEKHNSKSERVFANRLIPELGTFLGSGNITAAMGEVPSAIRLQNSKGQVLWLRLWEPTRFAIQESLK